MKVLSPESMKPSKLKRLLETKHTDCKDKDLSFFRRKANCVKPDNTVQRRISLMSEDIKNQVIDQMKSAGLFALQLEESTDVSSCAQLIAFVRYVHKGAFKDEFL